jgi:HD-GYP domain-containing protein (c-di-GMP phosphodiesterase class II)
MRLVPTKRLEIGVRLGRDVLTGRPGEVPLLRKGALVSESYRDALLRSGVFAVYIDDELGEGIEIEHGVSDEVRYEANTVLAKTFDEVPTLIASGAPLSDTTLDDLGRVARLIAEDLESCGDAVLALADLAAADAYTLQHSIDVTVVGLIIGQKLFRENGYVDYRGLRVYNGVDELLSRLGLGLLLHDIGKLMIPAEVLNKPGPLDDEEWTLVKAHPLNGLDLLQSNLISSVSKAVVRSHHERWDGRGYPDGRSGEAIPQVARVASVADVFDAVTSERPYRSAAPSHVGVETIIEEGGLSFDPEVVEVFRKVIAPYPPGVEITLADGRRGVVVTVPPEALDRPVVRIGFDPGGNRVTPYEISLADDDELGFAVEQRAA